MSKSLNSVQDLFRPLPRAKNSDLLAGDEVSYCCVHCKKLDKLTINMSILAQHMEEMVEKAGSEGGGGHNDITPAGYGSPLSGENLCGRSRLERRSLTQL